MITYAEDRNDELQAAFDQAHAEQPIVLELYCGIVVELVRLGFNGRPVRSQISPDLPLLLIRATTFEGQKGENVFRLNNNFARFYADLFRERHPEYAHVIKRRKRTSENEPPVKLPELGPKDYEDGPK